MVASRLMDEDVIRRMARLAHLDEADGADLAPDLLRVLEFVKRLRKVDVEGVAPYSGAGEEVTRADRPRDGLTTDAALEAAPDRSGDRFRVPRREAP